MVDDGTVLVEFRDGAGGQVIASSAMPADRLPDTFEVDTVLHMGATLYRVMRAEPANAADFVAAGRLVLTLAPVESVPARDILYSLPTLDGALPASDVPAPGGRWVLHEDDWRQVELVSAALEDAVRAELAAIHRIHAECAQRSGFTDLHVRRGPASPLVPPPGMDAVRAALPAHARNLGGVGFRDAPGIIGGSFAWEAGGVTAYGVEVRGTVPVLGLHPAGAAGDPGPLGAGLAGLAATHGLLLVDWCRCVAVPPEGVAGYLAAATG